MAAGGGADRERRRPGGGISKREPREGCGGEEERDEEHWSLEEGRGSLELVCYGSLFGLGCIALGSAGALGSGSLSPHLAPHWPLSSVLASI